MSDLDTELAELVASVPENPFGPLDELTLPDGHRATDLGNARRLIDASDGQVRYVPAWNVWIAYSGGKWKIDRSGVYVGRHAQKVAARLLKMLTLQHEHSTRQKVFAWARYTESSRGVRAMLESARSLDGVAVDHEALDANGELLNVRTGTVDLSTGDFRDAVPDDLLTMQAGVEYRKDATAPRFEQFVREVLPDSDVRSFVQRLSGLALLGGQPEHVLPLNKGRGANGKSTLTEIFAKILGEYSVPADRSLVLALRNDTHPTNKAALFRKRFAHSGELPEGGALDEETVKKLTGGDRINARRMREDFWDFAPTHLLWLHANHTPRIVGTDDGIWRRVLLIPWDVQISDDRKVENLADILCNEEGPGILNWMLAGLADYQSGGLRPPESVKVATESYRRESDTVARFIEDSGVVVGGEHVVPAERLKTVHENWFNTSGVEDIKENGHYQKVIKRLKELGVVHVRTTQMRQWKGLFLP